MSKIKPLARRNDIVIQEFGNEILIYDLKTNKAFNLNETSALIWQHSTGEKTILEIADEVSKKLNSQINEEFVLLALEQLQKGKLIEIEAEIVDFFQNNSRREIIKKVAFATIAVLPMVSTLVAPNAIHALSANCSVAPFSNGCSCSANANCSSVCCGTTPSGNTCVAPGLEAPGSGCRGGCECASGSCPPTSGTPRICV